VTLTGKPVLIQVDISGVLYFDDLEYCFKIYPSNRETGEKVCRLNTTGLSLVNVLSPNWERRVGARNSPECLNAKYNFIPSNAASYIRIGKPQKIDPTIPTTNTGKFTLSFPLLIPPDCLSGNYHISYSYQTRTVLIHLPLAGVMGNKLTIVSSYKNKSPEATSQNVVVGTVCSKPGATKTVKGKQYACILKGKKLEWIFVSGGSNSQGDANPTVSDADKLKSQGCRAFPPAIVQLQNASGSTYNKAFVSAQEATFYINDAARLESKYQGLDNAQRIIVQYVQDVGWLGKGYFGDINTVRTALATFNMACNSNLRIG
jgi:hypothetical protein